VLPRTVQWYLRRPPPKRLLNTIRGDDHDRRPKVTVKTIENLKPGASRREVPDGEVRGLYLAVFPSGQVSWVFRYRFAGRPRKLTIGGSPEIGLKDARDFARKAHLQVANKEDPGAASGRPARTPRRSPLDETWWRRSRRNSWTGMSMVSHLQRSGEPGRSYERDYPAFRGRRLSEIKRPEIIEWLDTIVDRGAPVFANRTLSWFKGLCNWAIARGLIEISPCAGIKPPVGHETARDRILTDDELKALWQAASAFEWPYRGFVQLLILTGQRRREVSGMTQREIDLDANLWTLPAARAKNSIEHTGRNMGTSLCLTRASFGNRCRGSP